MRKMTWLLVLTFFSATCFSQQQPAAIPAFSYDDYMKKSKKQKTTGWILTSVGTAGLISTLVVDASQTTSDMFVSLFSLGTVEPEYKSYTGYYIASGAVATAGIVYLVAAKRKKQKARALQANFKMERAPVLYSNGIQQKAYPSFAITASL